jgi:hypothetical protein
MIKLNVALVEPIAIDKESLFREYKDIFAWNYTDLKGIPPQIVEHHIELDTTIPLAHQARYRMNPNYATIVKQDLDKLLNASFITLVRRLISYHQLSLYQKRTASSKFAWIFDNSMLLQKRIHICYPSLKRYWMRWWGMTSIHF